MQEDELVVHIVKAPTFLEGVVNSGLAYAAIAVGFIVVLAAGIREALTGSWLLLAGLAIVSAANALVFLYGYLRLCNASVFVRGGRVGTTNWLRVSQSVPATWVDHLQRTGKVRPGGRAPSGVLLIVTKDQHDSLRFFAGDSLEPGGIERIAARIGVQVKGSWTDLRTWRRE